MRQLTEANVLEALKVVKDPDLHRDIVALNFVKNVKIDGRNLSFDIELTTPACPVRDELKAQSEQAIRSSIDVGAVSIEMTSNVTRHENKQKEDVLPGVRNTIAVASGKGGVGKSTVAVNLAVALAKDGAKVGLVDADVYGPSIPLMMGLTGRPMVKNQRLQPMEKYGVKVMSIGFLVDPMQAVIWRGPMASGAVKQFMSDVDWGELDYLVFDLPPGTGDIQLTLVQTIPLTGAVIVTTPQDISLADARKGFVMFQKVNVPVFGIVENMSYFACSHCGHREEIFDNGGGKRAAEELGVPFLGDIPIYTSIRVGGDTGKPVVFDERYKAQGDIIQNIARNLAAQVSIRNSQQEAAPAIDIQLM
ncbi:MAG: iron-sulfur cluster carrier protein ApbC [Bacteroidetes bacterium]|nr:iron-sulfur cluster carrier protein ApbC [Bacteroidota bacterium]MCW5897488.1 iron-sulfur cluster carrier protein ApbC [Bacteroidota bacterium]